MPVRYAVVGLGNLSQSAILPSFANAEASKLAALVSESPPHRESLGNQYGVPAYSFDRLEACLRDEDIQAIYIAEPETQDIAIRAARAKAHIICERPMATSVNRGRRVIDACAESNVWFMVAYRLHFNFAHLEAMRAAAMGEIGDPVSFHSLNLQSAETDGVAPRAYSANGPLFDSGVCCINAARLFFKQVPVEVYCQHAALSTDPETGAVVPIQTSAILRFEHDRIATFSCGFGPAAVSQLQIIGTHGWISLQPVYRHDLPIRMALKRESTFNTKEFAPNDQFGSQLSYFSWCIMNHHQPEPSAYEGLVDLAIIEALEESARRRAPCAIAAEYSRLVTH